MYFKTLKTSKTGKKFQAVTVEMKKALANQKDLAKSLNITQWIEAYWAVAGGMSACRFKEKPDETIWKNVNGNKSEWMPRLSTKGGKAIAEKMKFLHIVDFNALNQCIGFKSAFKAIGFSQTNKKHFGFIAGDTWGIKAPKDCIEITATEYKKLFGKGSIE